MNRLLLLVGFVACVLVGTTLGETSFEFPAKECAAGFATGDYTACVAALAYNIWKIHQWGEDSPINICDNQCTGNLKGRISHFEWKWDAKFQCQNKGQGIQGGSTAYSRDGAMEGAIKDWITKASAAGAINANDFKC
jgi:hypothetical protein